MTLPVPQYLVAFNNGPLDDPVNITTVATPPGTLGGANVWTDITPWVRSHHITRGRQHELAQFEAATCELDLVNRDGRFSPFNTSSPYNGLLVPRRPVQVRVTWNGVTYKRFTGHADSWAVRWPDASSSYVTLHAADAFRMFNGNNVTTTGYETQVLADSATGYWRMTDPVGSTAAADFSGSGFAASEFYSDSGTFTFGSTGALVAESATSLQLVVVGTGPYWPGLIAGTASGASFTSATGVTCELWVNFPVSTATHSQLVAQIPFTFAGTTHIAALLMTGAQSTLWDQNNNANSVNTGATNIGDGNWHHFVVTLTTGWVATFFIDGVTVATHTLSAFLSGNGSPFLEIQNVGVSGNGAALAQEWAQYAVVLTPTQVAHHYALATFPQQTAGARIGAVLNAIGWSATARNLDTNTTTVQAVTSPLTSTSSLSHMQSVQATESGALFMGTDGRVQFRSRQTLFSGAVYTSSQATIGDTGTDMPFEADPTIPADDIDLYNEAIGTRQGGNTQRATNTTSISNYGRVTWQPPGSLLGISDSEVLGLCQYAVSRYSTPVTRIERVTVNLADGVTAATIANVLALDLLYRVTVERTLPPGGGSAFSQQANVEHVEEMATPTGYTISFGLAKADPAWWVLGTSTLGQTTTLAF